MRGGSRQDPTWAFLSEMHELGFATANRWLAENLASVGTRSSLDVSLFAGLDGRAGSDAVTA